MGESNFEQKMLVKAVDTVLQEGRKLTKSPHRYLA